MAQITSNIMMIRPHHFGFNVETAQNNAFQKLDNSKDAQEIQRQALEEFDQFVEKLKNHGINVIVVEDTDLPVKPDAIFPNNWISFHDNGLVMTYPMYSPLRRNERRPDVIQQLSLNFSIEKDYTFEHYEEEQMFLEGTGSLILDRVNKIAYANLSQRTDLRLLDKWCILMGYKKIHFSALDKQGKDIYHTNVMMALGTNFCIICLDCIPESKEKENLLQSLENTGKIILPISMDQMETFAGNMLQVKNKNGKAYLVMSASAFHSLKEDQVQTIQKLTDIIVGDIPTIEKIGGGSVRCMMAEIFLPELPKSNL